MTPCRPTRVSSLVPPSRRRAFGRALTLALALLVAFTALTGCARVRAALAVQPDDTVNGEIVVATPETGPDDPGPAISVPEEIADDVEVSAYRQEGYTGSLLRFLRADVRPARSALGRAGQVGEKVQFSIRRAGNRLLVTGKADLTTVPSTRPTSSSRSPRPARCWRPTATRTPARRAGRSTRARSAT
jgi:hypothetical protein